MTDFPPSVSLPPDIFAQGKLRDPALGVQLSPMLTIPNGNKSPNEETPSHVNEFYSAPTTPTLVEESPVSSPEVLGITSPVKARGKETYSIFQDKPPYANLPPLPESDEESTASLYDEELSIQEDMGTENECNDLLPQIPSMYRLLDLFHETGSAGQGGLVEKILIDQNSLSLLLNAVLPGSYKSVSNIDFKSLDQLAIRPKGVYGDRQEIAKFLIKIGCIDDKIHHLMSALPDSNGDAETNSPTLGSGLYLVFPPEQEVNEDRLHDAYIIYWPEVATWLDNTNLSVQRNRVTFMRYLTQLCDQVVALISTEQACSFSWDSGSRSIQAPASHVEDDDDDSRMFTFEVAKLDEQKEDVTCSPGFKVGLWAAEESKPIKLVGGETTMGLLLSSKKSPKKITKHETEEYTRFRLKSLWDKAVILGRDLTSESRRTLMDNGLRDKYPSLFARYESEISEHTNGFNYDYNSAVSKIQQQLEMEIPQMERQLRDLTRERSRQFRAFFQDNREPELTDSRLPAVLNKYRFIEGLTSSWARKPPMANIHSERFQQLKAHIYIIRDILGLKKTNEVEQQAIINKVIQEGCKPPGLQGQSDDSIATSMLGKLIHSLGKLIGVKTEDCSKRHAGYYSNRHTDLDFLSSLQALAAEYPLMCNICEQVFSALRQYLEDRERQFISLNLPKVIAEFKHLREEQGKLRLVDIRKSKAVTSWNELWQSVHGEMDRNSHPQSVLLINDVVAQSRHAHREPTFTVHITHILCTPSSTLYSFHPLESTQEDIQQSQNDIDFVPRPILRRSAQIEFELEEGRTIEFIQPMHDKCLLIIASHQELCIFMNRDIEVGRAVKANAHKIRLHRDNLGTESLYAYDEVNRTIALVHEGQTGRKVSWYAFDENYSNLRSGGTIPLDSWYDDKSLAIQNTCFVTGKTDLCLIDSSGCARVLSLASEQFGPASLNITGRIRNAFSAPDGSCLFIVLGDPQTKELRVRAFHWASFGDTDGFEVTTIDPKATSLITSFERRSRIHLVSLPLAAPRTITSTALLVKQQSAEFDFRFKEDGGRPDRKSTMNNCLLDCHMDVWSRFPVLPAVSRNMLLISVERPKSITFLSEGDLTGVKEYFAKMIVTFERITQKPTDGKLFEIDVRWLSEEPADALKQIPTSKFHFGGFIVKLLCMIPIHLAVTKENCFVPLKDGVINPAFQRKLLGADVPTIINSLSIGWYESLFQSYMATKPVRVVSSMGEQSVGKSYCLNHFADTSFAGSAMRTTEGVWLSCTPTDDYLLVSLDFEGVQSIERSAQEDTLLVLFNAAMSNMVLFRNNFAISRNIAGLFKSFQSSATVLDPQSSPELFNSDLAIIIKDVINSDSREIVREFSQKFKGIVREEKEQNFITRLHRGQVHIIPWPVIKSRGFYTLFQRLRNTLESQAYTHGGGGVFLHTLKTLMAKIKANDWGALDKNLAAHRAQQLLDWMPDAIGRGGIEQSTDTWGPLKDIDIDQKISYDSPTSENIFWVPSIQECSLEASDAMIESILDKLIQTYAGYPGQRQIIPEATYLITLQDLLYMQFDQRIQQVRDWISINTKRFPQENQDIRGLITTFEITILRARAALQLCTSKCALCNLLCLRPSRHASSGGHDCKTNHACNFDCGVSERHIDLAPCGLPSGHDGRHLCEAGKHTCGQLCMLSDRTGCEKVCIKGIDHADDHYCSARIHFCGEPCSLRNAAKDPSGTGSYDCPGSCQIPWNQDHIRHSCANSKSCPIECQLCPRLCCNMDHFHGMSTGEVHLCGQAHSCTMLCEAPGICDVKTQPFAINEQFTGRYESFQFTRYAQEGKRLTCVVPIDPGQVSHVGPHTHSTGNPVFHFCDVQCPRCKYYCTLPLGHPQQLHETSHGSMTETQWFIEGPTSSASYQLQEHRYGSGDQGSTVLCSMVCSQQGRHVHVDYCRNTNRAECNSEECQHIDERVHPYPDMSKDWISHKLYWARSGFKDPYSQAEKSEFSKCDAYCPSPEHQATDSTNASPSYCKLSILHTPLPISGAKPGYISQDGHRFDCKDALEGLRGYHIVFIVDSSSSMRGRDRAPLPNTPISHQLRLTCNNRYGAVVSALYGFWKSRERDGRTSGFVSGTAHTTRSDTYSIITFNSTANIRVTNDNSSTTEQLIESLTSTPPSSGTNFAAALAKVQSVLETNWSADRTPAIIFLSDGECTVSDQVIRTTCEMCIDLGTPLAFFTISFGTPTHSESLRRMARIAHEVYATDNRPERPNAPNPCSYINAIDSIQLARTYLDISRSLQKPRAALIGSSNNRLPVRG